MREKEAHTTRIHQPEDLPVLAERARLLARDPGGDDARSETVDVIEFLLAGERYGIESEVVQEVCLLDDLTPVPGTPPFVLGIVNIHGRIISVIDLRKYFRIPDNAISDLNRVLVLRSGEMEFGVLADSVPGLRSIPVDDIQPPLPTLTEVQAGSIRGITAERMIILDGRKILSDRRIVVQDETDEGSFSSGT